MKKKVLITGFEAFAGDAINPSQVVIEHLTNDSVDLKTLLLPVEFDTCLSLIETEIESFSPDVVLALGLAGGRSKLSLERIAINVNDARISDNAGAKPVDTCVCEGAPDAYFSSLPIKRMYQRLTNEGIPVQVSNSAGTFVCNHLMFGLLHLTNTKYPNTRAGFIHLPYLPEQVPAERTKNIPSMTLETMLKGLELCIEIAVSAEEDVALAAGTVH